MLQAVIWNDMCYGTHQIYVQPAPCEHMYTSKILRLTVIKCICKRCFGCRFDNAHVHNQFSSFTLYLCVSCVLYSVIGIQMQQFLYGGCCCCVRMVCVCVCIYVGNISRWKLKMKERAGAEGKWSFKFKYVKYEHTVIDFFFFIWKEQKRQKQNEFPPYARKDGNNQTTSEQLNERGSETGVLRG